MTNTTPRLFHKGALAGTLTRTPTEIWRPRQRRYVWRYKLHLVADDGRQLVSATWSNKREAGQCLNQLGWC